ncbi:MAG TPA: hypothetical protein PKW21_11985 [Rhabdaerophilum sp.]|nr:hypothetical protein [Rhabdaerophilum sp.]
MSGWTCRFSYHCPPATAFGRNRRKGSTNWRRLDNAYQQRISISPGPVFIPERNKMRPGLRIDIAYADDSAFVRFIRQEIGA